MTPAGVEFVETAPFRIRTTLRLTHPPQAVWDVLADNEGWPEWFVSCKAARTTSETPDGVGSTRWVHVDQFKVNERFIAWDEPERWGFTIIDANMPLAETVVELVHLHPDGDGTSLTYDFTARLRGWARPLTPILKWRFTRMFSKSLAGLQPRLDELAG